MLSLCTDVVGARQQRGELGTELAAATTRPGTPETVASAADPDFVNLKTVFNVSSDANIARIAPTFAPTFARQHETP
jgi:hypothetical protein